MKVAHSSFDVTAPGRRCFVDVTNELRKAIEEAGISEGFAIVYTIHTTCALIINEWERRRSRGPLGQGGAAGS